MVFAANVFEFTEVSSHVGIKSMLHKPVTHKERILSFMNKKSPDVVLACDAMDFINNQPIGESLKIFSDDIYSWSNEVVYHFKNYDLKLDDEFIQYVLSKTD